MKGTGLALRSSCPSPLIPAKAGIQRRHATSNTIQLEARRWTPASAGVSGNCNLRDFSVIARSESDEAIQVVSEELDCFASLAMTILSRAPRQRAVDHVDRVLQAVDRDER